MDKMSFDSDSLWNAFKRLSADYSRRARRCSLPPRLASTACHCDIAAQSERVTTPARDCRPSGSLQYTGTTGAIS
jgi:hypothetical protein